MVSRSPILLFQRNVKNRFIIAGACFCFSVLAIAILFKISEVPNTKKNGFERFFKSSSPIKPTLYKNLNVPGFYIIEINQDNIFLANQDTQELLVANTDFSQVQNQTLDVPKELDRMDLVGMVDSNIYLVNRKNGSIFDYRNKSNTELSNMHFTDALAISDETFILRTADSLSHQHVISKVNLRTLHSKHQIQALEKQVDGFLCTDGMFVYDKQLNRVVYIYYYRNGFVCLDTNLNVIYNANTIDTTTKAKIQVRKNKFNEYNFSQPAVVTNKKAAVSQGLLFIHSGLLADNEDRREFSKSSVIDVYDLSNGKYRFSFHVVDQGKSKISAFRVFKGNLVAIQGNFLFLYSLDF